MQMQIRYTKFPYVFWTSTKPFESEIDFKNNTLKIEGDNYDNYCEFKRMNSCLFLAIKYLPLLLFIMVTFNKYDLSTDINKMISYCLALALIVPMILDDFAKKITLAVIGVIAVNASFWLNGFSLIAYALKYFIFVLCVFVFIVDLQFEPFAVLKNNKVVAHFLIKKDKTKLLQQENSEVKNEINK